MKQYIPREEELRVAVTEMGFRVKALATYVGLDIRTLQRRFNEQFCTTPKAWLMRERMNFAPTLLAQGLSNKEVAASLSYTRESNFCRDFKRFFGCAPQKFAALRRSAPVKSPFDKQLSRSDKPAELLTQMAAEMLPACRPTGNLGATPHNLRMVAARA